MTQESDSTPYLEALSQHVKGDVLSFHVPGHQGGQGADPDLVDFLGSKALKADITEVMGIDDLHRPHGQCGKAQRLAAQAFGAEETHFLVNGSTVGNQAMLLTCSGPGDLVLVPRNAHRSIWAGLMLSGSDAAAYLPPYDEELGVFSVPAPDDIHRAAEEHPKAKAIVITSPSYHGHACDIDGVIRAAHERGLLVLVDEAWGAHLNFHPGFPQSAVQAGADLVVQSTHKMLPALTQSAMLHVNGERVDRQRLDAVLRTLQTSSPSALLIASLDSARRHYALHGCEILEELARLASQTRRALKELEGIFCRGAELSAQGAVPPTWDPTRLVVSALARGYTGYELEARLRHDFHQQVEMSDLFGVVVVLTAGHSQEQCHRLVTAVKSLPKGTPLPGMSQKPPLFSNQPFNPREAFMAPRQQAPWQDAIGCTSTETISLYPPGIPWILPGERIRLAVVHELQRRKQAGGQVQGAYDPTLTTLGVKI